MKIKPEPDGTHSRNWERVICMGVGALGMALMQALWPAARGVAEARVSARVGVPGGGCINVEHLLPPFARLRLYTHGSRAADAAKSRQNCFWTALNFFNEQPDAQYLDAESVLRTVRSDYHAPDGPRRFGDLICLMDPREQPAHICVYIADDVVFTKDGVDDRQPWVLLKMADMLIEYPARPPFKVVTLRRNGR